MPYYRVPVEDDRSRKIGIVAEFVQPAGEYGQLTGSFSTYYDKQDAERDFRLNNPRTIGVGMLSEALNDTPSIKGSIIEGVTRKGEAGKRMLTDQTQSNPLITLLNIFFPVPPSFKTWFRGPEDILQIINRPIAALTVLFEYPLKLIGAALSRPFGMSWDVLRNKKIEGKPFSSGERVLGLFGCILGIIPLAIGQVFSTAGNIFGYARRTLDAACNIVSSSVALVTNLFRNKKIKYPSVRSSLGALLNNGLKLALNAVVFGLVLFPGGQFVPSVAAALAPLTAPLSAAASGIAGAVSAAWAAVPLVTVAASVAMQAASTIFTKIIVNPVNRFDRLVVSPIINRLSKWLFPDKRSSRVGPAVDEPNSPAPEVEDAVEKSAVDEPNSQVPAVAPVVSPTLSGVASVAPSAVVNEQKTPAPQTVLPVAPAIVNEQESPALAGAASVAPTVVNESKIPAPSELIGANGRRLSSSRAAIQHLLSQASDRSATQVLAPEVPVVSTTTNKDPAVSEEKREEASNSLEAASSSSATVEHDAPPTTASPRPRFGSG